MNHCAICGDPATWHRTSVYLCGVCHDRWAEPWPLPGPGRLKTVPQAVVDAWRELWEAGGDILEAALRDALSS